MSTTLLFRRLRLFVCAVAETPKATVWVCMCLVLACDARPQRDGDAPNATGGGAGSGGAEAPDESPTSPDLICAAANSEAACRATTLERLDDCDDCWHDCHWLELHQVESEAGECTFGTTEGRCVHREGGEGGDQDLIRTCLGTGLDPGSLWLERVGSTTRIGYVSAGSLTDATLERCGDIDDPFALAPECRCACTGEYPDAECRELDQAWESGVSSGVSECSYAPRHQVSREQCDNDFEHTACNSDSGACSSDEECGEGGRCVTDPNGGPACHCITPCNGDEDCSDGDICVCRHSGDGGRFSQCVPSSCETEDDCDEDQVCALSYGATHASGTCEVKALACRAATPDCEGVRCAFDQLCTYDTEAQAWGCSSNDRCWF